MTHTDEQRALLRRIEEATEYLNDLLRDACLEDLDLTLEAQAISGLVVSATTSAQYSFRYAGVKVKENDRPEYLRSC